MEHTAISRLLTWILLVPMVGLWAFHLYQRRFKEVAVRKRIATLSLTAIIIFGWIAAKLFDRYGVDDVYLVLVAAAAAAVVIWQRRLILPYKLHCAQCGKPLGITRVLLLDSNRCVACDPPKNEGGFSR